MASHHHHQQVPHHCHPTTTTNCYCCCTTCTPTFYSQPPPPPDPPVHSISSHHLHLQSPPPPPPPQQQHNLYSLSLNPPYATRQTHKKKQQLRNYHRHQQEEDIEYDVVSSLLRRITALESSVRHRSLTSFSLRDAAARTIQTHFRAFLVRRSRTLRQLKDLAFIKSSLNTLKSSLSENSHFESQLISQKAMDLLIKLDSIQGGDPMIRDGKRSISRELIRFMEFIDEITPKRHVISSRAMKNGAKSVVFHREQKLRNVDSRVLGVDERKLREKLRHQAQTIRNGFSGVSEEEEEEAEEEDEEVENPRAMPINGNNGYSQNRIRGLVKKSSQGGVQVQVQVQPKVKKNVRFSENGNVYRVIRSSNHGPGSSGDSDSIDGETERELMRDLCRKVEEIENGISSKQNEEDYAEEEDEESPQIGDDEENPIRNLKTRGGYEEVRKQIDQEEDEEEEDDGFVFSAPLPVKMEYRTDMTNNKQPVKK